MNEEKEKNTSKENEAPKCELKWEKDHFIVECETAGDRDRAAKALEDEEIVVKVKVRRESPEKK